MENIFLLYSKKNKQTDFLKESCGNYHSVFKCCLVYSKKKKKYLQKGTLGLFPQRPSILKLSTLCYWNNFKRSNYSSNCVFLNKLHGKWCMNQYMMKPVLHLSLCMIHNKFKCIIMLSKPVKRIEYLGLIALEKEEGKWNKYSSVWQGADLEMEFEI